MCNSARSTAPTLAKLCSALNGYITTHALPDPASVIFHPRDTLIAVQPRVEAYDEPVAVLSALLLWTRGLSGLSPTWRRITDTRADRLHVTIVGRLVSGVRLEVYREIPYPVVAPWVFLDPGASESASLDEIGWLIGELHAHPCPA